MEKGDLPGEPELELAPQHGASKSRSQKWPQEFSSTPATKSVPAEEAQDDFFGEDDEESS